MRILLLDNYDSFTWNLYDYMHRIGAEVTVLRNDAMSVTEMLAVPYRGIVLSPGPGRPQEAGVMMELIHQVHTRLPVLGICLGYQALGAYFGAEVVHSPLPMHGKSSRITHTGTGLFAGIPQHTEVMRYHSLNISALPPVLQLTAQTADTAEPMAISHAHLPLSGLQFHPESIGTPEGATMVANWINSLR